MTEHCNTRPSNDCRMQLCDSEVCGLSVSSVMSIEYKDGRIQRQDRARHDIGAE